MSIANIYRPGSKLHDVYAVFLAKGIEAAIKRGIEIGLAASTLKIQAKRKSWGGDQPIAVVNETRKQKFSKSVDTGKQRYCLKKGGRQFVVVHAGEQQSEARWLDTG